MIGAEGVPAAVAVELIAAGAEQFTASGVSAGVDFENGIADSVFVVIEGEAVEVCVAGGAGSVTGGLFHMVIINYPLIESQEKFAIVY